MYFVQTIVSVRLLAKEKGFDYNFVSRIIYWDSIIPKRESLLKMTNHLCLENKTDEAFQEMLRNEYPVLEMALMDRVGVDDKIQCKQD